MEIRPIHNAEELAAAKDEIARLWDATSDEDLQRLSDWADLVDRYEASQIERGRDADPVAVIVAEMEMNGRTRSELAGLIGQSRATEVLARRRPLTLPMIRAINREWGVPADLLIAEYETA
jgi:antitoxin component HigA of HigAB toxin-antitoxin module